MGLQYLDYVAEEDTIFACRQCNTHLALPAKIASKVGCSSACLKFYLFRTFMERQEKPICLNKCKLQRCVKLNLKAECGEWTCGRKGVGDRFA